MYTHMRPGMHHTCHAHLTRHIWYGAAEDTEVIVCPALPVPSTSYPLHRQGGKWGGAEEREGTGREEGGEGQRRGRGGAEEREGRGRGGRGGAEKREGRGRKEGGEGQRGGRRGEGKE